MAYEVTATRRRPKLFSDLVGQEFVSETLRNSIKSGQIAHAYLFTGPRGCGKTSSARILAKALNCQSSQNPTSEPCGVCESCKAITNSSSLDVIEIDGASKTSINDVKPIKEEVMFPPNSSRYKIYIIDEVHMLSEHAFNALLKTIEEPPPYVIFIFATTELQKVPATIKSRCQQFNFRLVSLDKIKNLLSQAAQELNIQAEDEALYWIARESGGSIRDAYTLFDQVAAFSQEQITYNKIRDKLGLLGVDRLNEVFEFCAQKDSENTMNKLDEFLQSGISIEQLISNSTEYLRSLLLIKNGITKESLLGQALKRYSQIVLESWNTIQIERALSIFLQLYRDIRYSLSPRYELELAFSRLCWLKEYVSPSEVKKAIDKAHSLLQNGSPSVQQDNSESTEKENFVPSFNQQNLNAENNEQKTSYVQNNNIQESVPNGMPTFSALKQVEQNSYNDSTENFSENSTGSQSPFYNGGTLPPEKSEAQEEVSTQWTNVDSYSSQDIPDTTEEYTQQNEYSSDSYQDVIDEDSSNIHNDETLFTASDGFSISMTKIFGVIVSELSVNEPFLASLLMQTGRWLLNGTTITTTIKGAYQKNQIDQNIQRIQEILYKVCHEKITFNVQLEQIKKIQPIEYPLQVQLLCEAFKGTVMGSQNNNN